MDSSSSKKIEIKPLQLLVFFVASLVPVSMFIAGIYLISPPFSSFWSEVGATLVGLFLSGISIIAEVVWIYWFLLEKNIQIEDRE